MTRGLPRRGAAAALLVLGVGLAATGCGSTKTDAAPAAVPLHGTALANEKSGGACSYLSGAEARPAGSALAPVGQAMLAHAGTLALEAEQADPRFTRFATDMTTVGQPNGAPALKRITAYCAEWTKHPTYFLTHPPTG